MGREWLGSEDRFVDPVLVAVSDCLVLTALERAVSRVLSRAYRREHIAPHERHSAYVNHPLPEDRIDGALGGAWVLCGYLVARHGLDVNATQWAGLLDGYTRALLMLCQPHETDRLRPHLAPLGVPERWTRPYARVGA